MKNLAQRITDLELKHKQTVCIIHQLHEKLKDDRVIEAVFNLGVKEGMKKAYQKVNAEFSWKTDGLNKYLKDCMAELLEGAKNDKND